MLFCVKTPPMNSTLKMGRAEWGLLLLLSLLWGSSFLFMKVAVETLPVFTVVLGRVGIAAILLVIYAAIQGHRLPTSAKMWGRLILLGFLRAALPISLFVWAGTQIDSNISGILNSTTPLFSAIVAHFFTSDEKLTVNRIVGIGLGMFGVVILMGVDALQSLGQNLLGQLAVLGATCSYGFAGVYGRRFKELPVSVASAGFLLGASLLVLPMAIGEQAWTLTPSFHSVGSVFALAILNTAIAFVVWFTLIHRAGATNTAQVTFIIPFMAILLGFVFLGEPLHWNAGLGLVFILLGLAVAQGRVGRLGIKNNI